jgi:hypothetical protein
VGDLRLVDAENASPAEVTVSAALLNAYRERLNAHLDRVRTQCAARSIEHLLVPTETPVERLVLETLRRRGVVG